MNEASFRAIVRKVLSTYQSLGPCPDQFIGEVLVGRNGVTNPGSNPDGSDFAVREAVPPWTRPDSPVVILVLESPHTDEFTGDKGPAKGVTGENIRTLFAQACDLRARLKAGSYSLILVNAIQYQCSLGCPPRCFRDLVFAEVWNRGGKIDFQSRMRTLYRQGDVIINACSTGKRKPRNWELVRDALEDIKLVSSKVEHPGNWARRRNTALKHGRNPNYGWKP